jgi:hypothetical protein
MRWRHACRTTHMTRPGLTLGLAVRPSVRQPSEESERRRGPGRLRCQG